MGPIIRNQWRTIVSRVVFLGLAMLFNLAPLRRTFVPLYSFRRAFGHWVIGHLTISHLVIRFMGYCQWLLEHRVKHNV